MQIVETDIRMYWHSILWTRPHMHHSTVVLFQWPWPGRHIVAAAATTAGRMHIYTRKWCTACAYVHYFENIEHGLSQCRLFFHSSCSSNELFLHSAKLTVKSNPATAQQHVSRHCCTLHGCGKLLCNPWLVAESNRSPRPLNHYWQSYIFYYIFKI